MKRRRFAGNKSGEGVKGNRGGKGVKGKRGNGTDGKRKSFAGKRSGVRRSAPIALVIQKQWLDRIV